MVATRKNAEANQQADAIPKSRIQDEKGTAMNGILDSGILLSDGIVLTEASLFSDGILITD